MFGFLDKDGDGFVDPQDWVDGLCGVDSATELAGTALPLLVLCSLLGAGLGIGNIHICIRTCQLWPTGSVGDSVGEGAYV